MEAQANPQHIGFRQLLFESGMLVPTDVAGVYGRNGEFESICDAVAALVTREAAVDEPERLSFPPALPRRDLESIDYLQSFPHLAGTVFSFHGGDQQAAEQHERASAHEDWSSFQSMTDLVLTPAACYPVYPAIAARGALPEGGITVDAGSAYVFRHEPSDDPARMQMFHQRELVRLGEPAVVQSWRDAWRERALGLLCSLGLAVELEVANDPFFGRAGRMLAASQRQQELKFEVVAPIAAEKPTALASFNYHQDHFSSVYGLTLGDGSVAHTACLGFGLERIALALLRRHGVAVERWPAEVREQLQSV
jgi:seryl-tRNA synthetase